ncbi:hypothetical protein BT96DRAFT_949430 [Gymnopus androsaceus JB14]|uniref:Uncharacterized protein n=1 Tax=Gymnopus androsaceus JB14 TaxID=1447944 RepID=A0A6A4GJZ2_9AGAR|nr:hypothetical protein BT96DRAFT_949430 [Gymnopus androsaceus JB14]
MDKDYDSKEAGRTIVNARGDKTDLYTEEALEKCRQDRLNHEGYIHISKFLQKVGWQETVEIIRTQEPPAWRMVHKGEGEELIEVILHVQGVVEETRLPPFKGNSEDIKKKQHMKQSIVIGGLGTDNFAKDMDGILDVYALFARNVKGLRILEMRSSEGQAVIEASNRIFTPRAEALSMQPAEVPPEIDHNNYIANVNAFDPKFVYGEENEVMYGEERINDEGKKRFHVRDIVDIGFCMIIVGKAENLKATVLLRTITLLDAMHTQKVTGRLNTQKWLKTKAIRHNQSSGKGQVSLKKRERFEEDEEDARKKMKKLAISNA